MKKKSIAILGSTGSIGTQALDVIAMHPDKFEAFALVANNNVDLLIEQAIKFEPQVVVIANETKYKQLKDALSSYPITVWCGADAICDVVKYDEIDMVLTAMVGFSGLRPTIHAIEAGKAIALANKETLVVAGELITQLALTHKTPIIPVDSEHSAIFQCLNGETHNAISKILLTASGGPFRGWDRMQLEKVNKSHALKHPNWSMGAKVTIDSASLMNKGLEMMEAVWLFGVKPSQVEVVVHPQSIIHSMVEFEDASVIAQLGQPDMRIPIQYAFSYPYRFPSPVAPIDIFKLKSFTFEQPDMDTFRNLAFAFEAANKGGNMPCIMNAANEIAVDAFLHDKVGFLQMSDVIAETMAKASFISKPSLDDYFQTDEEARVLASQFIN